MPNHKTKPQITYKGTEYSLTEFCRLMGYEPQKPEGGNSKAYNIISQELRRRNTSGDELAVIIHGRVDGTIAPPPRKPKAKKQKPPKEAKPPKPPKPPKEPKAKLPRVPKPGKLFVPIEAKQRKTTAKLHTYQGRQVTISELCIELGYAAFTQGESSPQMLTLRRKMKDGMTLEEAADYLVNGGPKKVRRSFDDLTPERQQEINGYIRFLFTDSAKYNCNNYAIARTGRPERDFEELYQLGVTDVLRALTNNDELRFDMDNIRHILSYTGRAVLNRIYMSYKGKEAEKTVHYQGVEDYQDRFEQLTEDDEPEEFDSKHDDDELAMFERLRVEISAWATIDQQIWHGVQHGTNVVDTCNLVCLSEVRVKARTKYLRNRLREIVSASGKRFPLGATTQERMAELVE